MVCWDVVAAIATATAILAATSAVSSASSLLDSTTRITHHPPSSWDASSPGSLDEAMKPPASCPLCQPAFDCPASPPDGLGALPRSAGGDGASSLPASARGEEQPRQWPLLATWALLL